MFDAEVTEQPRPFVAVRTPLFAAIDVTLDRVCAMLYRLTE